MRTFTTPLKSTAKFQSLPLACSVLFFSLFFSRSLALAVASACVRVWPYVPMCRRVFYKIIFIYIELHMKSTVSFNYCNWQFIIIQSRIQCLLLHCMRARICVVQANIDTHTHIMCFVVRLLFNWGIALQLKTTTHTNAHIRTLTNTPCTVQTKELHTTGLLLSSLLLIFLFYFTI